MIKNYTTSIPAEKSLSNIEVHLVKVGVTNISKNYDNGLVESIVFKYDYKGNSRLFKLQVNSDSVFTILKSKVKRPREGTLDKIKVQSVMTAWKILSDWVEVQCALIQMEQAEFMQAFLPYLFDFESNQTLFQKVSNGSIKLLN